MALLKSVKTNFGVDAIYWNIFSIQEGFKNSTNEIVIATAWQDINSCTNNAFYVIIFFCEGS